MTVIDEIIKRYFSSNIIKEYVMKDYFVNFKLKLVEYIYTNTNKIVHHYR